MVATAFSVSIPAGIATAVAVFSHEVPQEVGDFAVLLHRGFSPKRAFASNLLSGLTAIIGALTGYFFFDVVHEFAPVIMALAASSFLYVAQAGLIPDSHRRVTLRTTSRQLFVVLGILTITLAHRHQRAAEDHRHSRFTGSPVSISWVSRSNAGMFSFSGQRGRQSPQSVQASACTPGNQ